MSAVFVETTITVIYNRSMSEDFVEATIDLQPFHVCIVLDSQLINNRFMSAVRYTTINRQLFEVYKSLSHTIYYIYARFVSAV